MFHATYKEFQPIQNEKDYDKLVIVSEFGEGLNYDKETKTLTIDKEVLRPIVKELFDELYEQRIPEGE